MNYDAWFEGFGRGLVKAAEETIGEGPSRWATPLRYMAAGTVGLGLGTAAGMGLTEAANRLHQHHTGSPIPPSFARQVLPALGAASGLAYSYAKSRQEEAIRNALEGPPKSESSV